MDQHDTHLTLIESTYRAAQAAEHDLDAGKLADIAAHLATAKAAVASLQAIQAGA